jgi:energy-coupling factor transport system ATP-binding protein
MRFGLKDIGFAYPGRNRSTRTVFRDVSVVINSGECVGVLGEEGAGKTTLLFLLGGLLKPTSGVVSVNGRDIWDSRESVTAHRRCVGMCFQFPEQQFFTESVESEVLFALKTGSRGEDPSAAFEHALRLVDSWPCASLHRSPFSLSAGEARRIALASALIIKPAAVLMDEPTVGLDAAGMDMVTTLVDRLKASGATVVIATHDVDFLAECADRVLILANGGVASDGPARDTLLDRGLLAAHGYTVPEVVMALDELKSNGRPVPQGVYRWRDIAGQVGP